MSKIRGGVGILALYPELNSFDFNYHAITADFGSWYLQAIPKGDVPLNSLQGVPFVSGSVLCVITDFVGFSPYVGTRATYCVVAGE